MRPTREYHGPDDKRLAALATRQRGVVALTQLWVLGFTEQAIRTRIRNGRLHRVHRGVYGVGHARLSVKGRWLAAVMACGTGAVLSHHAAAALHDLRPCRPARST